MKSAAAAFTWEYWKSGWPFVLGALASSAGMLGVIAGVILRLNTIAQPTPPDLAVRDMFHSVFFATSLFIAITLASIAAGVPELRFTLPVTSWSIVTWPLLNGMAATIGVYLVVALAANGVFHAGWPVVKPALGAGCLFAICHGLNWTIQCSRDGHLILAAMLGLAGGVFTLFRCQLISTEAAPYYWERITLVETLVVGALVLLAYFAAIAGVAAARRGQPLSATQLVNFLCDKFDLHLSPARVFASAGAAQRWFEWSEKGLAAPIAVGVVVAFLFLGIAWGGLRSTEIVQAVYAGTILQVFVSALLGFCLGNASPHFTIREFTATRPASDTHLADAILWNSARSVGCAWLVWWAGVLLCWLYAAAIGAAPQAPMEFFPELRSDSWMQVAWYVAIGIAGSMLASWTFASIGASWVLVRQWLFFAILFVSAGLPLAISIGIVLGVLPEIWGGIQRVAIALILMLVVSLYAAAYYRNLIGWRRVSTACILFGLLLTFAALLASQLPAAHQTLSRAWLLALTSLPFLSLAAAPLALGWNRHR